MHGIQYTVKCCTNEEEELVKENTALNAVNSVYSWILIIFVSFDVINLLKLGLTENTAAEMRIIL